MDEAVPELRGQVAMIDVQLKLGLFLLRYAALAIGVTASALISETPVRRPLLISWINVSDGHDPKGTFTTTCPSVCCAPLAAAQNSDETPWKQTLVQVAPLGPLTPQSGHSAFFALGRGYATVEKVRYGQTAQTPRSAGTRRERAVPSDSQH